MLQRTPVPTLLDPPHRMSVEFPHTELMKAVLGLFGKFLEESQEYKDSWTLDKDDEEGESEYGYLRRSGTKDRKQLLHYRKNLVPMLRAAGVDYKRHAEFIDSCEELFETCRASSRLHMTEFARHYARAFDQPAFESELQRLFREADESFQPMLRIMEYEAAPVVGQIIAIRHADKGLNTLHAYASEDGLEFGWNSTTMEDFVLAPIPAGYAELFPGRKMPALTDWRVPALLHQVRVTTIQKRQTIVFFDHTNSPPVPRFYRH